MCANCQEGPQSNGHPQRPVPQSFTKWPLLVLKDLKCKICAPNGALKGEKNMLASKPTIGTLNVSPCTKWRTEVKSRTSQ